jgi:hypothetical protein
MRRGASVGASVQAGCRYISLAWLYHRSVERTQISLTATQARRLRQMARRRRTSMAALIRDAVDRVYPESSGRDDAWERALGSVGRYRSGQADVSTEHDRDLADAFGE